MRLAIQDVANGCAPAAGAAVYIWHCDREGRYSLYSPGVEGEDYLRGVQAAGSDGVVTFTSIFPGCYQGRWPHIHFEVYPSLDEATEVVNAVGTSQIALPEDACDLVYATEGYEASVGNLSGLSLSTDMVFREDGAARQLGHDHRRRQFGLHGRASGARRHRLTHPPGPAAHATREGSNKGLPDAVTCPLPGHSAQARTHGIGDSMFGKYLTYSALQDQEQRRQRERDEARAMWDRPDALPVRSRPKRLRRPSPMRRSASSAGSCGA